MIGRAEVYEPRHATNPTTRQEAGGRSGPAKQNIHVKKGVSSPQKSKSAKLLGGIRIVIQDNQKQQPPLPPQHVTFSSRFHSVPRFLGPPSGEISSSFGLAPSIPVPHTSTRIEIRDVLQQYIPRFSLYVKFEAVPIATVLRCALPYMY